MSLAKRNAPPGLSARARRSRFSRRNEATLPVALLRPGIGIEQVDGGERGGRQPVEQVCGIAVEQADIGKAGIVYCRKRAGHAVEIGLDADEAGVGRSDRRRDQMLAAAEADLQRDALRRVPGTARRGLRATARRGRRQACDRASPSDRHAAATGACPCAYRRGYRAARSSSCPAAADVRAGLPSGLSPARRGWRRRGRYAPTKSRHRPRADGRNDHKPPCAHRSAG